MRLRHLSHSPCRSVPAFLLLPAGDKVANSVDKHTHTPRMSSLQWHAVHMYIERREAKELLSLHNVAYAQHFVSLSLSLPFSLFVVAFPLRQQKNSPLALAPFNWQQQLPKKPAPVGLDRPRYSPAKLNCLFSPPSPLFLFVMLCLRLVILFSSSRHINKIFMAIC